MNPPLTETDLQHIGESILAGNKGEAMQRYRKVAPVGLAVALRAVEEIEARMRAATPEAFVAGDAKKAKRQKRFRALYWLIAAIMAIIGVDGIIKMVRGEMTSWLTVSLPWISMLCFIGAARSTGRSVSGPPQGR